MSFVIIVALWEEKYVSFSKPNGIKVDGPLIRSPFSGIIRIYLTRGEAAWPAHQEPSLPPESEPPPSEPSVGRSAGTQGCLRSGTRVPSQGLGEFRGQAPGSCSAPPALPPASRSRYPGLTASVCCIIWFCVEPAVTIL